MDDTLEYWQGVLAQHETHVEIARRLDINDSKDLINCQKAVEEAKRRIKELS